MSNIIPFQFGQSEIRVIQDKDGNPWFVAKDVCASLGFKNPSDATKYIDEDDRTLISNPSGNGGSKATIINESGLYSLILRSRKPEAKKFKKWVTSEVLPSIRKTGSYQAEQKAEKQSLTDSTSNDRRNLRELVDRWVRTKHQNVTSSHFRAAWSELNEFMQVDSIKDIPLEHLTYAIQYVEEQTRLCGVSEKHEEIASAPLTRKDAVLEALASMSASQSCCVQGCFQAAKLALLRGLYSANKGDREALFFAYDAVIEAEQLLLAKEVNCG
ncbi:Bro-N domain-containing protein [Maridesulfovibrio ferrireducens]|uniref:BRO-N domain-containing protein n=1 Tax=Maridesulfovibrio ferrireducens TaxID=246191 RepID=UPI001A2E86E9|nr:Bro-N domain-containing protein [Maridesulfovibrio ferrireducens]MBI9110290.1 Bro-N domain-containing protein [Maridesulfovibrio ferrireducens]